MKSWTVIGFTADADIWCKDCAEEEYGPDDVRSDREGNLVNPIFASDMLGYSVRVTMPDMRYPDRCCLCGEELG